MTLETSKMSILRMGNYRNSFFRNSDLFNFKGNLTYQQKNREFIWTILLKFKYCIVELNSIIMNINPDKLNLQ